MTGNSAQVRHLYLVTRISSLAGLGIVACTCLAIPATPAQNYPTKPIRLVTAEAGGGNDFAARLIVQGLGGSLGQNTVIDNGGGAGGSIAAEIVAKARPMGTRCSSTPTIFGSIMRSEIVRMGKVIKDADIREE